MRSMTGFGAGSAPLMHGQLQLEIRALNHKHTDVRLRLPHEIAEHTTFFEQLVRERVGRGRYDLSVRLEGDVGGRLRVDETKLRAIYQSIERLRAEIAPESELSLSTLATLPEVLHSDGPAPEAVRAALQDAFSLAHDALTSMRKKEGSALKADLSARITSLRSLKADLEQGSAELVEHHRERLRQRVTQLVESTSVRLSHERLEQEVALLADKSDITEELVRLSSHFAQFSDFLGSDEPVGRRLDFLLQEITREVNTVGSKSQHAKVAHLVVQMKSEVERIREQVQNVD